MRCLGSCCPRNLHLLLWFLGIWVVCGDCATGQESADKKPAIYEQQPEPAPIQSSRDAAEGDNLSQLRNRSLAEGPKPLWIWGEDANTSYVIRKTFVAPSFASAWLAASCDNSMSIELNGRQIGTSDS
ncbi:MAG: hypothetical protein ACK6A7_20485, partial [Planctomycetota bacterium]